ncbi:Galactomannan galactosyltransferase, family GT34 [Zostera marina]|uniref:Galactomannan galactosyltransferase, family GT34 n=1 Tax=Zostera marina TaxID=29655 RepID=A0A0K9NXD1_ZOSMR|nr:Galactomannan galactosyltransferase, family GT34 [Zostera marina]
MAAVRNSSKRSDFVLFLSGAVSAIFLFFFIFYVIPTDRSFTALVHVNTNTANFYSDPNLTYTIATPLHHWDSNRRLWIENHKPQTSTVSVKVLLVSASRPTPCSNPIGDHLLLRLFKNKQDYSRIHGFSFFYNTALFHPEMFGYWNKIPTVRSAMVAHPEVDWIWWIDSDAAITDMDFVIPFHKYKNHNMVVHGWPDLVYNRKSWTGLNAGVFLMRNCQWSLDLMDVWAQMGPQTPHYVEWGKKQKATVIDKLYPEADDQTGLVYLMSKYKEKWGDKIYLEYEYRLSGYWLEIIGTLDNITKQEEADLGRKPETAKQRYAEVDKLHNANNASRRPFVTHFTGCQPCSGKHNINYSDDQCWDGMRKALDFADDQVLHSYGFRHVGSGGTVAATPSGRR